MFSVMLVSCRDGKQRLRPRWGGGGGEGTLCNGLYGEAPPERGTFSVIINIIITIIPRALMGSESIAHEAEPVADPGCSGGFLAAKKD